MSKVTNPSQTDPLLHGDLIPARTDFADLRNDNAGTLHQQLETAILRFLETNRMDRTLTFPDMYESLTRFDPFIGLDQSVVMDALMSLLEDNLVRSDDGQGLQINRVATKIARAWLQVQ